MLPSLPSLFIAVLVHNRPPCNMNMPPYTAEELAWLLFYSTFGLSLAQIAKLYNRRFSPRVARTADAIRQRLQQIKRQYHLANAQGGLDPALVHEHLSWFIPENDLDGPDLNGGLSEVDVAALSGTATKGVFNATTDGWAK